MAQEGQAEQRRLLAEQRANVDAVEAGQRRLVRGGGGGMLAFLDDEDLGGSPQALGGTATADRKLRVAA